MTIYSSTCSLIARPPPLTGHIAIAIGSASLCEIDCVIDRIIQDAFDNADDKPNYNLVELMSSY